MVFCVTRIDIFYYSLTSIFLQILSNVGSHLLRILYFVAVDENEQRYFSILKHRVMKFCSSMIAHKP